MVAFKSSWLALGAFRIASLAGRGATAEVYRAFDKRGATIALKVAHEHAGDEVRRAFAREASHAALALTPRAPELVDVGWLRITGDRGTQVEPNAEGARPFVALTWMEGEAQSDWLTLHASHPKRAAERHARALALARDVGDALAALHAAGIAHGDVKPANILVDAEGNAALVDFGLATTAYERSIEGATPRYLARGDADLGDARARDLIALGLVVAEAADPRVAGASDVVAAARAATSEGPLGAICSALLAPQPGARPSATWVAESARAETSDDPALARRHRGEVAARRVRATYLGVRQREIAEASSAAEGAAPWLLDAVLATKKARALLGPRSSTTGGELEPLDVEGRARWLTRLVGSAAVAWPLASLALVSEERLARALVSLASKLQPEAWTLRDIELAASGERHPVVAKSFTSRDLDAEGAAVLALALARVPADARAIEAVERMRSPPLSLARAAAEALRLAGELGRAKSITVASHLGDTSGLEGLAADILRRSGDLGAARACAENALAREVDEDAELDAGGRARAVLARLALDEGRVAEAERLIGERPATAALSEVASLAATARGDVAAALAAAERGDALATTAEERARLSGARGFALHGTSAQAALAAFGAAVDHAVRAGAVIEEATYRTGEAAEAVDVGDLGRAIETSRRAALLWEHFGRPALAARALLATAAAYACAGVVHDARRASRVAAERARDAGDPRAEAYAMWAVADALADGDPEGLDAAERAHAALLGTVDELRAYARVVRHAPSIDEARVAALDTLATAELSRDARLDWWGARAARLTRFWDTEASLADERERRARAIVSALVSLANVEAAVAARGRAFAAGAELAGRAGLGEAAQRLLSAQADAARELVRRAPEALAASIRALPWTQRGASTLAAPLGAEQARDLERLVQSLTDRERLGPLLNRVVDALVLWTGVERGLLLLRAPDGRLVPRAARNLARGDLTDEQLALSQSLARRALDAREVVVAVDAAGEMSDLHASVHALHLRSVLAVPLIARGEVLGVAYLDDRVRRGAFGEREREWVRTVAALAALAVADARDQVLLRRAVRRAQRARAELETTLAHREAALDVAERELARAQGERTTRFRYDGIIGRSRAITELLKVVDRVTNSEVPVLLLGQSGSGKELIARAIHHNGPRARHAFVTENCGAIPEGLLESELFGHVRGAFTGADRPRTGLFEVAHKGTLFLDEIGEMSLGMQTKLLRLLEDGEVKPVGSEKSRKVDVRIIAATHRDLDAMVKARTFREDLFYRLNVVRLHIPPLVERPGDVPLLVQHFVTKHAVGRARVTPPAMDRLGAYAWPGNIRQLENEVRRALVLSDGVIGVEHLSPEISRFEALREPGSTLRGRIDALEASMVREALERAKGNQTQAAKELGVSRFGLQKMIKRLGIA